METVKFTNSLGQSVKFADAPFFIQSVEGLGGLTANVQSQKSAYQDGSIYLDTILDDREIAIGFLIVADFKANQTYGDVSQMREYIAEVLDPKLGEGTLEYKNERVTRIIKCVPASVPDYPDNGSRTETIQKASISFIAHNPLWQSTDKSSEPMSAFVELFEFPFDSYFELGTEGHVRTFENNGNSSVPIRITINGPTTNPCLRNDTTGEIIKINRTLSANDVLVINTDIRDKYVLLNGVSAFGWVDLTSTFWQLERGLNEVQFIADNGIESAKLTIEWHEKFLAV